MAGDAGRSAQHDPAARGHDGRQPSPVDAPALGEVPSPAWLAQLGRAPIGQYADGRDVVRRLTEDGLAVPGDDPLYQYLGAQRVFAEILKAQQDDQLGRMRAMADDAQQALSQLLADAGAAAAAALVARRAEDEAALKRFSAELEDRADAATRIVREALAEERDAMTAAVALGVAEVLARVDARTSDGARAGPGWRAFGDLAPSWAARGRSAAAWGALLVLSVMAGLTLLWAFGRLAPGRAFH